MKTIQYSVLHSFVFSSISFHFISFHFGITREKLSTFIIPGFNSEQLKKSVNGLIDEHFKEYVINVEN